MDDGPRYAPTEIIPGPRRPDPLTLEPGVLIDPGPKPPPIDRAKLIVVSGVVATLLGSVVALATLLPWAPEGATPSTEADPRADPEPPDGDEALIDLESISPSEARHLVKEAGRPSVGEIEQSWTWTDRNGFNLLTTSRVTGDPADDPTSVTVRVSHVANLDGRPRQLSNVQDPVSCDHRGRLGAGFTAGALRVSDLDGDGIAEVTAGWWFTCGDDQPDGTTVKLAVLSDGRTFVMRGTGPGLGEGFDPDLRVLAPTGSFEPEPGEKRWPRPFLTQARALLGVLHGSPDPAGP